MINLRQYVINFLSQKFNVNLLQLVATLILLYSVLIRYTLIETIIIMSLILLTNALTRIKSIGRGIEIGAQNQEMMDFIRKRYEEKYKEKISNDDDIAQS